MAESLKAFAEIITALGSIAWPIIVVVLVWKIVPLLRDVWPFILKLIGTRGVKVKVGEVEVTLQDATESLRTQIVELQKRVEETSRSGGPGAERSFSAAREATGAADAATLDSGGGRPADDAGRHVVVLWVDDNLAGNAYEQARLRDGGVEVVTASTTAQAMDAAKSATRPFDAVVTDMSRDEGGVGRPRAGLELIRALRAQSLRMPVVVYTGHYARSAGAPEEVKSAGGDGVTGSPIELFSMLRSLAGIRA